MYVGRGLEEKAAMILGVQQNVIIVQALPAKYLSTAISN
jgi:mannose/fructose-specific phosphotransferase system component IIA